MNNFRYKLMEFMNGRYGTDKLNLAILVCWIIFGFLSIFIHNIFYSLFLLIFPVLYIFRFMSRNVYKRSNENRIFLECFGKIKNWCSLQLRKIKDIKTHRYIKCPNCKANMRVPNKRGKHTVCCPKCHRDFQKRILI